MELSSVLNLLLISLLGAMSPGASLLVVIKNSILGRKFGFITAWSHALGIAVYAFLTLNGLNLIFKNYPNLFNCISVAGALYLLWIGYNCLKNKSNINLEVQSINHKKHHSALDGISISLLNPQIGIYFIAIFSLFIPSITKPWGHVFIQTVPPLIDGLWYTLVAFAISNSTFSLFLKKNLKIVNIIMGVLMLILGLYIIFELILKIIHN